jgi:DNA-binding transcriptional ArsR family regulator
MDQSQVITALAALAQDTRLSVFRQLVTAGRRGMAAGELADALTVAPATLSFHLKELAHAGLVTSTREGRVIRYRAAYTTMDGLIGYLTRNCCRNERQMEDLDDETDACCAVGERPR